MPIVITAEYAEKIIVKICGRFGISLRAEFARFLLNNICKLYFAQVYPAETIE